MPRANAYAKGKCLCLRLHYQIFIRYIYIKFTGFFEDIFEEFKSLFFKGRVSFPGILGFVTLDDDGDFVNVDVDKLWRDYFSDILA